MKTKIEAYKLIKKFKKLYPDRELLFFFVAGSHFFDLASPTSDLDFRGVYLPSPKEYYEGESRRKMIEWKTNSKKNQKNSEEDVDCTFFSITKFLELLKSGDFNCMEMLFTPKSKILVNSPLMEELRSIRKNLLINDISAFLGFIKKEYKRYGVNIYHYKAQEDFYNFLGNYDPVAKLRDFWKDIVKYAENDPHISITESLTGSNQYVPAIKIAQRFHQNTVRVHYVRDQLKQTLETYGYRQKNMAKDGVEFKGLYHALRLIYEANDLFDFGEFRIPFDEERHKLLKRVKNSDIEQNELFNLIDSEIEMLYNRERGIVSNKNNVRYRIDKLLFQIDGKMKLKFIMEV